MHAIGIDFGTTNSVVAMADAAGGVRSFSWPNGAGETDTFRTALTFWREGRLPQAVVRHAGGPQAIAHALSGTLDHRFIQSIKTHAASRQFTETRLYGRRFTIVDLVALFLEHLVADHREAIMAPDMCLVAGRPVVFAGESPDEALAVERLTAAYRQAGFADVDFAYEPLGAAYWYARDLAREETVLVADFGGGTSDFSLMHFSRRDGRILAAPLAHGGVGIAGDVFDYRLIDHVVAPRLGKGTHYRSLGKVLPLPAYFHAAFAQWHQLSWLNTPQTLNELRRLAATSEAPQLLEDLATFIEMDLGFDLYQAVSRVKAQLSQAPSARLSFAKVGVQIEAEVTRADFENWIADDLRRIASAMDATLAKAKLRDGEVDAVFMTGGTSYVPAVRKLFTDRFGPEKIHFGNAFQSVASGLALMAADRVRQAA
jgi:hypothetical chaperone protein